MRTILFRGYSDDCHNVTVDGQKHPERYSPYDVLVTIGEHRMSATMEFDGRDWTCTVRVPDYAIIEVEHDGN
jgi:hypothetical protein